MRVVEMSNKSYLVRHWFKWYRVSGSMTKWEYLFSAVSWRPRGLGYINTTKVDDAIEKAATSLSKAGK